MNTITINYTKEDHELLSKIQNNLESIDKLLELNKTLLTEAMKLGVKSDHNVTQKHLSLRSVAQDILSSDSNGYFLTPSEGYPYTTDEIISEVVEIQPDIHHDKLVQLRERLEMSGLQRVS